LRSAFSVRPRSKAAAGEPDPMNFYYDLSGWTLMFAVLISAVVCAAFGIWMGWLSTH
jgi:hypothetical protein